MPVSVVCESAANVNAAIRDSLSSGVDCSSTGGGVIGNTQSLQDQLVASAKRVLLTKIEYEEVENYNQSILDTLKSKYIVLKPTSSANDTEEVLKQKHSGVSGCSNKSMINHNSKQNGTTTPPEKKNSNELPLPKRVLYQRDNIRIGWKNSSRKWQVGAGMMNVGNTCYLNSTLQALFHVPSMANWLMSDSNHMEKCEAENSNCIICAVSKTLQASQSSQNAIKPFYVYSKLKSICRHMNMGWQEDAHEFLRYLVESMEKSFLSRFRNFKELDQYSKETTPLNQILGGYLKSSVRCLSCGHVSVTFQHFQDLLLDIRKVDTIEEALDAHFSRERLEDMGYKCESCKKKVSATKQFSLERAPIALCIQLKRFNVLGAKLNKQITIRPRIDLSKFSSKKCSTGEQLTYKLVAMITHLGASQHCGHYTAIGLTESGTYYSFDDSFVRPISIQNVCNTNAYIIFYEMDTSPVKQPTSTVVTNAQMHNGKMPNTLEHLKENGNHHKSPDTMATAVPRMIGPQLPSSYSNGYSSNQQQTSPTQTTSKLSINRQNCIPTSSSKLVIHFKNTNSNSISSTSTTAKESSVGAATTSSTTTTTTTNANNKINGSYGTSKFQDYANSKTQIANNTNKGKISPLLANNIKRNNESSNDNDDSNDDDDNKVTSTQNVENVASSSGLTLPSMPTLGEILTPINSKSKLDLNLNSTSSIVGSSENSLTSLVTTTATTNGCNIKSPFKSLVPYESESDDEDDKNNEATPLNAINDDSNDNKYDGITSSTAATINVATSSKQQQTQSSFTKTKQKTDIIDSIFNAKRNNNNNNSTVSSSSCSSNNNYNNSSKSILNHNCNKLSSSMKCETPTKKLKLNNDYESNCSSSSSSTCNISNGFKRAKSTPPSPPVIKTTTGLWQVTSIQQEEKVNCSSEEKRKHKNPFATDKSNETRRSSKNSNVEKRFSSSVAANGYSKSNDNSNTTVNELLKHTHRGYGASVLNWNGSKSEMEKEIIEETRVQRKRDWEEEDKTEMDRGRQKKIKSHNNNNSNSSNPGYNPFEEQQRQLNSQSRWKGISHSGGYRYKNNHFRSGNHFHNNHKKNGYYSGSSKYKRYNNKFHNRQQHHHRKGGSGGGHRDFHRRSS